MSEGNVPKIALEGGDEFIRRDRMRYEKNTLSSNLAILAIVFNMLYFMSIYRSNVGSYYYTPLMGASIVCNMLFMLIVFLIAEGSKSYHVTYSYIAIAMAVLQFVRIGVYPVHAHAAQITIADAAVQVMGDSQFNRVLIYMIGSGVCLLLSAFIGIKRSNDLKVHLAQVEKQGAAK